MRPKSSERQLAEMLRRDGWTYDEISEELHVSKSSLSLWLRALPPPSAQQRRALGKAPEVAQAASRARWDKRLSEREEERRAVKARAAAFVGALSDRELELLAVTAYWCEGAKDKAYARRETVKFINSDPGLMLLFLEYLRRKGFGWADLHVHISIHESADIARAERWWADVIGSSVDRFGGPSVKRHRPTTNRKNTGMDYVGCLVVSVRGSRSLYQEIEGAWRGITEGWEPSPGPTLPRWTAQGL